MQDDGTVTRHPLAYLLEAADDISYRTADLEDAFKKGLFTLQDFITFFKNSYDKNRINKLHKNNVYVPEHYSHILIANLEQRRERGNDETAFNSWMQYTMFSA